MPKQLLMQALSPTMEEGTLAKWLKKEGDAIAIGDVLAEVETDKATVEMEAPEEGILGKILVKEGTEGVKVNAPIAWLLEEGEDASALKDVKAAPPPAPKEKPKEAKKEAAPETPASKPPAPQPERPAAREGNRIFASPLARRIAGEEGIDLAQVQGSGPKGRIVLRDLGSAPRGAPAARPSRRRIRRTPGELPAFTEIPNTNIRKVIGERLTQVHQEVPTFFLSIDCEIDALLALRKQANELVAEKLSVNDFLIRAAALALMEVPAANASWDEKAIRQYAAADISMAVATDRGLITPVIQSADAKTVQEIAAEAKALAEKARAGKLRPEEFQGGTFTISNLGMFGIRQFDAILNPPQACILAVGAGEPRAVVKNGQLTSATVMSCTLTCDHRVVDGAVGAEFLAAFKRYVEEPARMLLKEAGYG